MSFSVGLGSCADFLLGVGGADVRAAAQCLQLPCPQLLLLFPLALWLLFFSDANLYGNVYGDNRKNNLGESS